MRKRMPAALIALGYLISLFVYRYLPSEVPIHWDFSGEPDRWVARLWGALALPTIMLVNWALFVILPRLDPRRENISKFQKTYDFVVNAGTGFLLLIHLVVLGTALGWAISLPGFLAVGFGSMIAILGNVLPRARPNWTFGIRTPWTLENRRVWERTHRVGGVLLVAAGLLTIGAGVVIPQRALPIMLTALIGASAAGVIFSYFAWRMEVRR
jgi:uncharacterized membrane protein